MKACVMLLFAYLSSQSANLWAASDAFEFGRSLAKDLWERGVRSGAYDCDHVGSVLDPNGPFLSDAEKIIKSDGCVSSFPLQPLRQKSCLNGAESFISAQAERCVHLPNDRTFVGELVAREIVAKFCQGESQRFLSRLPHRCINLSKMVCRTAVYDELRFYFGEDCQRGRLRSLQDLTETESRSLEGQCSKSIETLATLPVRL